MTSQEILKNAVIAAEDRKALDIKILSVKNLTTIADHFIICTGNSSTHIKAIADAVLKKLKDENVSPNHIEGYSSASWILLDYGATLVHVFLDESRKFYMLEKLWSDAEEIDIKSLTPESGENI